MKKSTLIGFSICAVVLIVLTSFPSVVGYQQVKSAKSQDIKEMLQAIKVSPNYEKSFGGFYLTIALIHLILYLIFTGLSGAGFFNLFNFLKGIFFALTWPLEDISILALAIFFINDMKTLLLTLC